MEQKKTDEFVARIDTEAQWAIDAWDHAWNGGFVQAAGEQSREYLHDAVLALNALGNLRLAQAIHRQNSTSQ